MKITVRPYVDADLLELQAALAGWTKTAGTCGYCHVGALPHLIFEVLRGRWPASELVQVWDGRAGLAGIAINGLFGASFLVFTAPPCRGTQAELEMLQLAGQTTRRYLEATQQHSIPVNTDVYGCDRLRIDLLSRLGFTRHRAWDHIRFRSLAEPVPEVQLAAGFGLRPATEADYTQLAQVRNEAFHDHWTPDLFREQVLRKPGYQPGWELVVVAPDGQIAASTVIRRDEVNRVGLFEPVGTRPAYRRQGLARAMLLAGMHEMKRQGMVTARIEHAAANQAAGELYRSLGFRKQFETFGYQK
jgi:ribosomal protein S18 acetylase RimI-like enzyme